MDLNKENMRKIRELIVFTIVILIGLWKYTLIADFLGFILNIIFPFLLGGAIAFILNVPMSFLESKIFGNDGKDGRPSLKYARPCSLTLTILCVIGVIVLVMFVVIPELGSTFMGLGKTIQDFTPAAMAWVEEIFHNNQGIMALLEDLNMDWDKILDGVAAFFKNGAGSVLDTTMSAAKSIISSVTTFFIAFVFSCYILLQKEKLRVQVQKIFYAYLPGKIVEKILDICSLTYRTFSSFLAGQCVEALILGMMFLVAMWILRLPYALLVGVLIAFTALIPIFGAFIGCVVGAFLILGAAFGRFWNASIHPAGVCCGFAVPLGRFLKTGEKRDCSGKYVRRRSIKTAYYKRIVGKRDAPFQASEIKRPVAWKGAFQKERFSAAAFLKKAVFMEDWAQAAHGPV